MDLWLAIAHHLTVFSLVAVFIAEAALIRPGMTAQDAQRVARIDLWYGILAGVAVIVGVARVYLGAKGPAYYGTNPWFWAKMTSFVLAGLLSVPPTLRYLRWRRTSGNAAPSEVEVGIARRWLLAQGVFLALIPVFAAAMARYAG